MMRCGRWSDKSGDLECDGLASQRLEEPRIETEIQSGDESPYARASLENGLAVV
jgi:hypothetical protein